MFSTLKESAYEWAKIPEDLPKENLVLITAKTTASTYHPTDPKYKIRKISASELEIAGRSLAHRPVGDTHGPEIPEALVVDAQYNPTTQSVEALVYLPTDYINWIKSQEAIGKKVEWSVEYGYRDEKFLGDGIVEFSGVVFNRVDILRNLAPNQVAGDKYTQTQLVDEYLKSNRGLMEASIMSEGSDKIMKEAAEIAKLTDDLTKVSTELKELKEKTIPSLETEKKGLEEKVAKIPDLEKKLSEITKERDDATNIATRLQNNSKTFESEKAKAIAEAEKKGRNSVISAIREVVPENTAVGMGRSLGPYRALADSINKKLCEVSEE